jgi:hypothetical protein
MSVSSPFIHRPDRDVAARGRRHARRLARLSVAADLVPAAGRFPHRHHPASRGKSRRDGVAGDGAARAQFSDRYRAPADDMVRSGSATSRCSPTSIATSTPPRRTCKPLSTPPGRRCRETCRKVNPPDAPIWRSPHLAARPQRHCRHTAGAAAERTHRHGRCHGPAQRIKNELPKLLRWMPVGATHRGARRNRQHPSASVVTCTSR